MGTGHRPRTAVTRSYTREVVIGRSPQEVFAYLSDLTHELEWNPIARSVERLTDGPVGVGTRYRARWAGTPTTTVEVVRYELPHAWATRSRSMGMVIEVEGSVEAHPDGCRYSMHCASPPPDWLD
jgi:uncharacterized protein YndB with AHSA1/START domain